MTTALHDFAPEEIMAHHDCELPVDRAEQVSAHLEICAECRDFAQSLRSTSQSLATWSINAAPLSLENNFTASTCAGYRAKSDSVAALWRQLRTPRALLTSCLLVSTIAFVFMEINATRKLSLTPRQDRTDITPIIIDDYVRKLPSGGEKAGGGGGTGEARPMLEQSKEMAEVPAPMIARSVQLQIVVKKFDDARGALQSIIGRHQGYAASLNVGDTENTARTLTASLRIPSEELVAALAELKSLGHVSNESQAGEEVTAEHADLVARLTNSRETEARLQDILRNRTGKVGDVLEVAQEIARVRGEIEQMESQRKSLEHRVDFATIHLTITEEYQAKVSDAAPSATTQFHNAAIAGYENVTASALGLALWFTEYLPPILFWLALLVAPIALLWLLRRRAIASAGRLPSA
jgi:hypothetical protein